MSALKHLHVYERSLRNPKVYRCTDPDCSHYVRKEDLLGKRVKCKICLDNNGFILSREDLRRAVPRCPNCSTSKNRKVANQLIGELADLFSPTVSTMMATPAPTREKDDA